MRRILPGMPWAGERGVAIWEWVMGMRWGSRVKPTPTQPLSSKSLSSERSIQSVR